MALNALYRYCRYQKSDGKKQVKLLRATNRVDSVIYESMKILVVLTNFRVYISDGTVIRRTNYFQLLFSGILTFRKRESLQLTAPCDAGGRCSPGCSSAVLQCLPNS